MGKEWEPVFEIKWCRDGGQHFWLPTTGKGLPCFSCPMCGQLIYWSDASLQWIKPATSGDKPIPGNTRPKHQDMVNDLVTQAIKRGAKPFKSAKVRGEDNQEKGKT